MKKIPQIHSIINIIILIICVLISIIWKLPIFAAIFITAFFTFGLLVRYNYPIRPIIKRIGMNIKLVSKVLIILGFISILIPLMMQIGALPNLIYYFSDIIAAYNILICAFIIASIMSMLNGTAIGTLTILVPLFLSIAYNIKIPVEYVIGALVSGAYFGDRTSPLSSCAHLTATITKTKVTKNIKLMLLGSVIPVAISITYYYFLGNGYTLTDTSSIEELKLAISNNFDIHWFYLIPIFILIGLIVLKVSIVKTIIIVYFFSLSIYLYQGFDISNYYDFSINGYLSSDLYLSTVLKSSGLIKMVNVLLVIIASAMLNSLFEVGEILDNIVSPFLKNIKTYGQLTKKASLLSIILSMITCNQTLTSIVTGNYMNQYYDDHNIDRSYLAKTIGDTGLNIVGIIPWNVNGLMIATLTGVSTLSYARFSVFILLLPIMSTFIHPLLIKMRHNYSNKWRTT